MNNKHEWIGDAYRRMPSAAPDLAGWKIGATNPAAQKAIGADGPFYACLFDTRILRDKEPVITVPRPFDSVLVEVEICYRLRAARQPYDNPARLIKDAFPAIELVLAPGGDLANMSLRYLLENNGAHHCLVLGDTPLSREAVTGELPISVQLNNGPRIDGSTTNVLGHPENALAWLLDASERPPENIFDNALVTTGSCTPVVAARSGDRVTAKVGEHELAFQLT